MPMKNEALSLHTGRRGWVKTQAQRLLACQQIW